MNKEIVVRIVKPSEQPSLPKREAVSFSQRKKKNLFQIILSGLLLVAAASVGIFIAVNLFKVGIDWKDILLLLGVPLVIGSVASYLIS